MPLNTHRGLYSLNEEREVVAEIEAKKKSDKQPLKEEDWRPIGYENAKLKFGFRVYGKRRFYDSRIKDYIMSTKVPNSLMYEPTDSVPPGCKFQENKDNDFIFLRMLLNGFVEGAILKAPRQK